MLVRHCHPLFLYLNTACVANKHFPCVSAGKGKKFSLNRVIKGSYYWTRVISLLSTFVLYAGCPLQEEKWQRQTLGREGEDRIPRLSVSQQGLSAKGDGL